MVERLAAIVVGVALVFGATACDDSLQKRQQECFDRVDAYAKTLSTPESRKSYTDKNYAECAHNPDHLKGK